LYFIKRKAGGVEVFIPVVFINQTQTILQICATNGAKIWKINFKKTNL